MMTGPRILVSVVTLVACVLTAWIALGPLALRTSLYRSSWTALETIDSVDSVAPGPEPSRSRERSVLVFPSEGHWVPTPPDEYNSTTLPLLDRYESCWTMNHVKWVRFRQHHRDCDDARVRKVNQWRWESPQSLRRGEGSPTLRDVVQRHLNGKTIAIVGDSLSAQHTASMVCSLVAELDSTTKTSTTGPMVVNVTETIFPSSEEITTSVQYDLVWTPSPNSSHPSHGSFNMSILYMFSPYLLKYQKGMPGERAHSYMQFFWLDTTLLEPALEDLIASGRVDYFVFNFGHWLNWGVYPLSHPENAAAFARDQRHRPKEHSRNINGALIGQYRELLDNAARVLRNRTHMLESQGRKAPQIVLRTTSYGHFDLPNSNSNQYTCTQHSIPFNYRLDANGTSTELLDANYYPFDKFLFGTDIRNMTIEAAPILNQANLTGAWVVDGESTSRDRIDAHTAHNSDCLHVCLPSVFEVWTDALFRQIWNGVSTD